MEKKISKWYYLSATFMFAAATFQIVSDRFILGVIFFAAAVCFASAAASHRKREKEEDQQ